jgi:hypothetical protein
MMKAVLLKSPKPVNSNFAWQVDTCTRPHRTTFTSIYYQLVGYSEQLNLSTRTSQTLLGKNPHNNDEGEQASA